MPRPGTITPSGEHLTWHAWQVFKRPAPGSLTRGGDPAGLGVRGLSLVASCELCLFRRVFRPDNGVIGQRGERTHKPMRTDR
jgi:hypothetical protein